MERIHVSVRARPLSLEDAKTSPWRISGNSISIPNQLSRFDFDRIFGEDCKTEDVYFARTRDLVAAAVRGFNGTVFAYGQTSSGKTHTMRGSNTEPGVIPLAVHDLFNIIQQETDREFLLRMSYMEIYNEEINDLLAPEHRKLQIHESIERGIFVAGLRENIVASADQVLEFMDFGESRRHIGETNMNVYSSRSHTIFRMIIESREKTGDAEAHMSCDAVRVSVLNLVDLAGSERAAKTGAEGVRLKEGSHINKSLMTLGTVIKKLSEDVESQGGHVPYRDSKLTRILQPALGGNANTAIICNITLAQIHADETKSSLQFASRALRVTNCAHVNEILTDAALLKRQKKEIEELRTKLQGFNSEHLEGEILNLRNTLLKSEVERERIALELQEERRAQVEKEKRLQAQEKKIENLSSMVLCANREEISDAFKKAKRRDTWCPGNLSRETLQELGFDIKEKASEVKPTRKDGMTAPLLPFKELAEEVSGEDKDGRRSVAEDCALPDPRALMHVTSRRKYPHRKKPMESNNLADMQAEYEKLRLKYETLSTTSDIQVACLMGKLADAGNAKECTGQATTVISDPDENCCSGELDAILVIKQLQEKIAVLEREKSLSQQNLYMYNLVTEQSLFAAQDKYEKLCGDRLLAREEATLAHETLISSQSRVEEDCLLSMFNEVCGIELEFENSRHFSGSMSQLVDELFHLLSVMSTQISELRTSALQNSLEMNSIIRSHEKLHSETMSKIHKLESEKRVLCNETSELSHRVEELSLDIQNSANTMTEVNKEHELELSDYVCQIQMLEGAILLLSSSSLTKEKESIRKDLEKTKQKLKDTEFKLKNAVQEKIKLEGEKSHAEREVKRLHGQKVLLERDMSKRESIIGRRSDSTIDRSSNVFDQRRGRGSTVETATQDEYKKLEVLAFEMEATIASLDERLGMTTEEKDEATSRAEALASELQILSNEFYMSSSELSKLKEEVVILRTTSEESKSYGRKLESSLQTSSEEKEELLMQLTEALLTMEEEKAIWLAKEKASMEVIQGNHKQHAAEVALLSDKLSKAELLKVDLKEQVDKLTNLEIKMRNDKVENNKEQAKLKMQLRGTQAKMDAYRVQYEKLVDESDDMNTNFVQASTDLKKKLASSRIEVLDLKKQLAIQRANIRN